MRYIGLKFAYRVHKFDHKSTMGQVKSKLKNVDISTFLAYFSRNSRTKAS